MAGGWGSEERLKAALRTGSAAKRGMTGRDVGVSLSECGGLTPLSMPSGARRRPSRSLESGIEMSHPKGLSHEMGRCDGRSGFIPLSPFPFRSSSLPGWEVAV